MNKQLIVLVGPSGSGKSTFSKTFVAEGYTYINQDSQGKAHHEIFNKSVEAGENVVVDRMNFSKGQRQRYIEIARSKGYMITIAVLHESYNTCFKRIMDRKDHETIKDEESARGALNTFFTKYERPTEDEYDVVLWLYPEGEKPNAIWIDVDNTLSDATHREHHLQNGKKNWKAFFDEMSKDSVNDWCRMLAIGMKGCAMVLICSARPDNYRKQTEEWLAFNDVPYDELIMRNRSDQRKDSIVKEIMYDFEIKTRYNLLFSVDDRKQVIDQMRSRNVTVLDCAGEKGHF